MCIIFDRTYTCDHTCRNLRRCAIWDFGNDLAPHCADEGNGGGLKWCGEQEDPARQCPWCDEDNKDTLVPEQQVLGSKADRKSGIAAKMIDMMETRDEFLKRIGIFAKVNSHGRAFEGKS